MSDRNDTLRTIEALAARGLVPRRDVAALDALATRYTVAVTPEMARAITGTPDHDPIARQFVPTLAEAETHPPEDPDPIGDARHEKVPGLIHRYPDRVLLKVTHACPVYCRFCFRREMVGPGGEQALSADKLDAAVAYIATHPAIFEVILTGGDPLILSARRLRDLTTRIAAVPHVHVLRWHTRVPVVAPERITDELVAALKGANGKAVYVGVHANHAREFTPAARAAVARLVDAGVVLVSQTVLLKGVNDDAATLADLMRTFVALRIKPYYLHHADYAPGTAHFRTTLAEGQSILRDLRGRLSGLAQPTYVLDIPGGVAKIPVGPGYVGDGHVLDPDGHAHLYPPARQS